MSWVWGLHAVEEMLRSQPGQVRVVWLSRSRRDRALLDMERLARSRGVAIRRPLESLNFPHRDHAQGAAAEIIPPQAVSLGSFIAALKPSEKKDCVLVALDQIQDPHNLGAVARSALNLGARALVAPARRSASGEGAAMRSSAGALSRLPLIVVPNMAQALSHLKESGFWLYAAAGEGTPAFRCRFQRPLVVVIGSEGRGLRALPKSLCDEIVSIPQGAAAVASLNASCAATALLYEIYRQAHAP